MVVTAEILTIQSADCQSQSEAHQVQRREGKVTDRGAKATHLGDTVLP